MATNQYVTGTPYVPVSRTAWGAIFGGTFVYLAIMATFGALAGAIFASAGNATGMIVWMTILGIISMYFAGRAAGHLANVPDRNTGMYHGLITFGMSVFATILVLALAYGSTLGGTVKATATLNRWDIIGVASNGGWGLFVSLFLGFCAAILGGAHVVPKQLAPVVSTDRDVRRVA